MVQQKVSEAERLSKHATEESRDYVLSQPTYSDSEICEFISGDPNSKMATSWRQNQLVLGIWDGQAFRHPKFQFGTDCRLDPRFAELLAILPAHSDDRTGWRRAFWLYFPNELLEDREPAGVWAQDSQAVLDAARAEFEGED